MREFIRKRSGWLMLAMTPALMAFCGCASGPPSALEQKLFTVTTNFVPVVVTQTVWKTNEVIVTQTNAVGVVTEKTNTTFSALQVPTTNWAARYEFQPNTNAVQLSQTAGGIAGLFGPFGGVVQIAAGGILGLWGLLRSRKANQTSAVLAQIIETGREALKATPDGDKLEAEWTKWMTKHQKEQGVLLQVIGLLQKTTDNADARLAAGKLADLIRKG